jgi:glycosyltransferase involved in cell wall biosynthesis
MDISVVIPTCNRKSRLLSLLGYLQSSSYPIREIIIVDSSDSKSVPEDYQAFSLPIIYIESEKSVCKQRNIGIRKTASEWIFLCDDDIEVPADYLEKLVSHAENHPKAGALSGLVLQKEGSEWKAKYDVYSSFELVWKFIFKLSVWGEIRCNTSNPLIRRIINYYKHKGNHISKAGWPVITDFSGDYFITPVYALGASLVRRNWLLSSPFDEVLDQHGIGDNYGVAMGFPEIGVHVITDAYVYHHEEPVNRLKKPVTYFRRALALDYFIRTKESLVNVQRHWLVWSLMGNLLVYMRSGNSEMVRSAFKSIWAISLGKNEYKAMGRKQIHKV